MLQRVLSYQFATYQSLCISIHLHSQVLLTKSWFAVPTSRVCALTLTRTVLNESAVARERYDGTDQ